MPTKKHLSLSQGTSTDQALPAEDFEKLGVFYLGRPYDLATKQPKPGWLLYDSKDLVTHAVCVGMTGSGKTGLCVGLLEEAAIDGIPAIVIDPKGDLTNLLLTFPQLRGEDFVPWVNEDDARKKGLSRSICGPTGRTVAKGAGGVGTKRRAHSKAPRCGRVRRLHAGEQCRAAGIDSEVVCRSVAGDARRYRTLARTHQHHGDQFARPGRGAGRSDQEP